MFFLAHVKWFTENRDIQMSAIYNFSLSNIYFTSWLAIAISVLITAFLLNSKIKEPTTKFFRKIQDKKEKILKLFQILIGTSLLFASYRGAILAPHYQGANTGQFFELIECATGILLIVNTKTRLAAILLLLTYLGTIIDFGFFEAMDYINLIGIAIFIFLSSDKNKKLVKYEYLALPLLRIFTGIALVILAFSEKLLYPSKAYELVDKYDLNFMSGLGIEWFNHELFILSAGVVETIFGLILIFGWITRINTIALTSFFIASNIYFLVIGYPEEALVELTGHLPLIGTVIILIIYGSGHLLKAKHEKN